MSFIMDWVSQIILFIFLATIVSLLIPKNSHEKVVKLVFGLIIFLLFLHPIKTIFQVEPEQIISEIQVEDYLQTSPDIEEEISDKKKEIQASTDAYILEQLEEQVENIVSEELIETYGVAIHDLSIQMDKPESMEEPQMELLTFTLEETQDGLIEPVERVSIPRQPTTYQSNQDEEIIKTISTLLELPLQAIEIEWEGG